jgi:hypothetical protein
MLLNPVPEAWLLPDYLLQGEFSTFIVDLFKTVEAIAAVPHHLAVKRYPVSWLA